MSAYILPAKTGNMENRRQFGVRFEVASMKECGKGHLEYTSGASHNQSRHKLQVPHTMFFSSLWLPDTSHTHTMKPGCLPWGCCLGVSFVHFLRTHRLQVILWCWAGASRLLCPPTPTMGLTRHGTNTARRSRPRGQVGPNAANPAASPPYRKA